MGSLWSADNRGKASLIEVEIELNQPASTNPGAVQIMRFWAIRSCLSCLYCKFFCPHPVERADRIPPAECQRSTFELQFRNVFVL